MSTQEAWIALAGTVFGGVGMKLIEAILGRRKSRDDFASSLRTELRTDISSLRIENEHLHQRLDQLENTIDHWRDKYYALLAQRKGS